MGLFEKLKNGLQGEIIIPSDKSISHRAVIFSSLAKGKSIIKNFSKGQDPVSSLKICQKLGIEAEFKNDLIIKSNGKFTRPANSLDCGNSGTTMRFFTGILAGQNFNSILIGDESLSKIKSSLLIANKSEIDEQLTMFSDSSTSYSVLTGNL